MRQHYHTHALLELTLSLKIIGGYVEAQANRSQLGQLIYNNVDAANIARQRVKAQQFQIVDEDAGWIIGAQVQNE